MGIVSKTLALMMFAAAVPAGAQTVNYTFNTTGNMSDDGVSGNALKFSALSDPTVQMRVTGWQSKQSTNAITSAYVGAYSGGLGITGKGDWNGDGAFHQVDNVGDYTDFLLLQFNRDVILSGVNLNVYNMSGLSNRDSDLAFYNAKILQTASWDSPINLAAYNTVPVTWTTVEGGKSSGSRVIPATTASSKWLVSAAFLPTNDTDDGFKIASLTVTQAVSPVPEPATWAMMLFGFGAAGAGLRRKARTSEQRFTAKVRGIASGQAA